MNTGKEVQKVCDLGGSGTGAQAVFTFQLGHEPGASAQIELTATGSLTLEGRISPDAPWIGIFSTSASGFQSISRMLPQVRVNVTANTGTVRVWVMA